MSPTVAKRDFSLSTSSSPSSVSASLAEIRLTASVNSCMVSGDRLSIFSASNSRFSIFGKLGVSETFQTSRKASTALVRYD